MVFNNLNKIIIHKIPYKMIDQFWNKKIKMIKIFKIMIKIMNKIMNKIMIKIMIKIMLKIMIKIMSYNK